MIRIWADIKSPSDAHVIAAFVRNMPDVQITVTVRDRAEAIAIAASYGLTFRTIGRDSPSLAAKVFRYGSRVVQLHLAVPPFDASLSFNNMNAILLARLRRRTSISLMDNDLDFAAMDWSLVKRAEMKVNLAADHILVPAVFPIEEMIAKGAHRTRIQTFNGYKEDLYLADFHPDATFTSTIPFAEYVVLRPEARSAVYVRETETIVPALARLLTESGQNIVYLPRVPSDRGLLPINAKNIHVPATPPNGLQLAWHAKAVLTGSGSFVREAACLGVPAASFFPERLLAVDARLVQEGRIINSRDPQTIVDYALTRTRIPNSLSRSRAVLRAVVGDVERCVHEGRAPRNA